MHRASHGPGRQPIQTSFTLPYAFYNERFGAAVGAAYGAAGWPQPQATMLVTAMGGTEGSGMLFFIGNNLQVPYASRLFVDPIFRLATSPTTSTTSVASQNIPGSGRAATTPTPRTLSSATVGTTTPERISNAIHRCVPGRLWRMRAYPSQRFTDQAAIYYSAELRLIPEWNPFEHWDWIQRHLGVQ